MFIIRTKARIFEDLFPIIKEFESKGFTYLIDEDDGTCGMIGVNLCCCKRTFFNDGKREVTYEDRTKD